MAIAPRITFRHLERSPALEERVRTLVARLDHFSDRITDCHVVVAAPPAHHGKGGPYTVKIGVALPGGEINVDSGHAANPEHADVYVALRDAFDSAKRQLQNFNRD